MKISITEWDIYPFVFSLGILPIIIGLVYFRHNEILSDIDDKYWMLTVFFLALIAIIFTFYCKWKEDALRRIEEEKRKMEEEYEQVEEIQHIAKTEYEKVVKKLTDETNKIIELIKNKKNRLAKGLQKLEKEKEDLENKSKEKSESVRDPNEKLKVEKYLKALHLKIIKLSNKIDELKNKIRIEEERIYRLERERIGERTQNEQPGAEDGKTTTSGQLLIFAALYAIIGGLAITQALTVFSDPEQNPLVTYAHNQGGFWDLLKSKPAFIIASFYPIAILFIHCGIVFLSTDARDIISKGNKTAFFFSSLILFLEAVVLFYAGNSIVNIVNFSFWIFVLMIMDIAWIIINLVKDIDSLFQWLHLDSIMLLFLLAILIIYQSASDVGYEVYWYVLIIFVVRTALDYKMGWQHFWSKFDVSEKWT